MAYDNTEAATAKFTVQRKRSGIKNDGKCITPPHRKAIHKLKSCTLWVAVGSFSHHGVAGANTFHFTGRINHRRLPPSSYRLRAVASLDGLASNRVQTKFHIKKN